MTARAWRAAVLLFVLVACSRGEPGRGTPDAGGDAFASVTAERLRAEVRALHAKAVLVNAWATWCDSCQHELPMLQAFADRFASQGIRVLLVSVDEPGDRDQAKRFLADNGIHLTSYLAARPLGAFKEGLHASWPGMLPASFLFDGTGKVRYFWGGEAYEKEIVPIVEGLLAGKNIDGETRFDLAPGQTSDPR